MAPSQKIPVIIDTDPGVDDAAAILLALASPEIQILGYVVTFGNTDQEACYRNIFKLYQAVGRHIEQYPEDKHRFPNFDASAKPFVVKGASRPWSAETHTAEYFHGRDGLGDITQRHPDLNVDGLETLSEHPYLRVSRERHVAEVMGALRAFPPRSITYIGLGPLTSLRHVHHSHATEFQDLIGRVICMGGALDVPGNTSAVAEFNTFGDPEALRDLIEPRGNEPRLPIERFLLLPLDITTPHELPFPLYKKLVDPTFHSTEFPSKPEEKPPVHHFTSSFMERSRELMLQFGKDAMELHDPVTVWCAMQNPPVVDEVKGGIPQLRPGWVAMRRKFQVECKGEYTRGMLVVDRRDDQGAYAPGENRAHVQAELERLKIAHGAFESSALPARVEVEDEAQTESIGDGDGVAVLTETPGAVALVNLLFQRIWGVEIP
ncbi:nucleoside hydrolase [Gloeophyllum trabeum ATCC 11539]|uniref:Nucleoside hydrolase n=1 Tax=Gloeophyllum trabeum (strain ATCC 11539 / FP-39264 / Madison 617) TaxID=670483 RepID=S7QDK2_GLOTA|nr:nucleoside hydrolase [Gloeophyllum trabeum ATCC 11539]EPQ57468.1 nucleoside hydrolase [Gloeophyllum trabeum ATCC 11539]